MDPVLELQGAIVARLKADPALTALVGAGVYDGPPAADNGIVPEAKYPYVSIGAASVNADNADCIDSDDIVFQIDAWSVFPGRGQLGAVVNAIRQALRRWEPPLAQNALVTFDHWRTDYIRIPGINHASIRYTALIERP